MDILQLPGVQHANGAVYNQGMTEIELKTFGERVTWLLRRRRMANQEISSQKELAARIGMKPQQLNAYMSGRRAPNVRHLRAIAAALETSVSFLALTSNNSEPDSSEVLPDDPDADHMSEVAAEAAQLVEAMSPDLQEIALDVLRVLVYHEADEDADPTRRAGGVSGRLILGKAFKNVKKSSGTQRLPRIGSE